VADDNIIIFPENRIVKPTGATNEEQKYYRTKVRERQAREYVEASVDMLARDMLSRFVDMGMKTNTEAFTKDLALTIDCIRGMIYRDFKIEHPAQKVSEEMVTLKRTKGQISAKLDYAKVLKLEGLQSTDGLSEDTLEDLEDVNSSIEFIPDFDNDKDD